MKPAERIFHILTMMTQFGCILPIFLSLTGGEGYEVGESAPINTFFTALILVVSVILVLRHRAIIAPLVPSIVPIVAFLILALASVFWSDYPDITIRRTGSAITAAIWCVYLASRFSLREIVVLVAQSCLLVAAGSLFMGAFFPDLGVAEFIPSDPGPPGWIGIAGDKNTLGCVMATGMITMFYLVLSPAEKRTPASIWLAGAALCGVLLYLSQSRTSWAAAFAGLVVCLIVRVMYRRPAVGIIVWAALLLLGLPLIWLIFRELGTLTALVGKDATFTGRIDLWAEVLPYGALRPWFGYGYGAFWVVDSPITQAIWEALNSYRPPHAHNGWIETYLELGLVGCMIVAVQVLTLFVNSARAIVSGRDVDAPYMLLITTMLLVFNIGEADLTRAPALFWPFLFLGPIAIKKILRRARTKPKTTLHASSLSYSRHAATLGGASRFRRDMPVRQTVTPGRMPSPPYQATR
jgi:exopolysaccharide production protein ExoQ